MAFTGMSYEQFVADQKKKGVTVQGGDGSYNRYTAAQSSGQAGSGYTDSGGSGATLTPSKPSKPSGSATMVNVGGTLYRSDQKFDYYNGFGATGQIDAAKAGNILTSGGVDNRWKGGNGTWIDAAGDGPGHELRVSGPILEAAVAPPPAPVAPSGGGGGGSRSALNAPSAPKLKAVTDPITKEERDEITKPATGLEDTIKTSPRLLRERRRRSYLTAGG